MSVRARSGSRRWLVLVLVVFAIAVAGGAAAVAVTQLRDHTSRAEQFLDDLDAQGLRDDDAADEQLVRAAKDLCRRLRGGSSEEIDEVGRVAVTHFCAEEVDRLRG